MPRRIYEYTCRTCRRRYSIAIEIGAEEPGSQTCTCIDRTANAWWTSHPEDPFATPDLAGEILGPHNEEIYLRELEAQREREGRGDEPYTIKDEEPAVAPAIQLALL